MRGAVFPAGSAGQGRIARRPWSLLLLRALNYEKVRARHSFSLVRRTIRRYDTTKQTRQAAGRGHREEVRMAKRILAVDDEPHIVRLIKIHFKALGEEVAYADDGQAR